ncbi:MAG: hypothetical protein ACNA8K_15060 [Cyclonatronaceae bacterium]
MQEDGREINYSVIYYIHADSDYLFHDSEGNPVRENSQVLETAMYVGEEALSGEVFIYHQRSEKKTLGLFPRRSSRLYHYRNGKLIGHIKYRHPDKKEAFLATEADLLTQYRSDNRSDHHQNYFLFFGHEIPSENGKGYHLTLPAIDVNTLSLAKGVQNLLLSDADRLSLALLSTCNNGTPAMAKHLIPFTDVLLASPQNLHLSHIDTERLALLESEPGVLPLQLGRAMAEKTYQRLEDTVHTTITLGLYDLKNVEAYINSLTSIVAGNNTTDPSAQFQDNTDCAESSVWDPENYRNGVHTWYKPARFGRQSGHSTHSGWGCKPGVK